MKALQNLQLGGSIKAVAITPDARHLVVIRDGDPAFYTLDLSPEGLGPALAPR